MHVLPRVLSAVAECLVWNGRYISL